MPQECDVVHTIPDKKKHQRDSLSISPTDAPHEVDSLQQDEDNNFDEMYDIPEWMPEEEDDKLARENLSFPRRPPGGSCRGGSWAGHPTRTHPRRPPFRLPPQDMHSFF